MVDERLPSASVGAAAVRGGAAGPLGRRLVGGVRGGRGRREELVGEDGGPLATDYRRHGAAALQRRRRPTPRRRGTSGRQTPLPLPSPTRSAAAGPRPPVPPTSDLCALVAAMPVLMGPDWSGPVLTG